jgi:hypothetical protein
MWQAMRDTAKEPSASMRDWQLLASAGAPGRSLNIRGTYKVGEKYAALDVATLDSTWFVARRDDPGPCPGPGWQVGPVGRRGEKGVAGEQGPQGPRGADGKAAPEWVAAKIEREKYLVIPIMSDGSEGPPIKLRELFDQYDIERRGA